MKLFVPILLAGICLISLIFNRQEFKYLFFTGLTRLIIISPIFYLTFTDPGKYNSRFYDVSILNTNENVIIGFIVRYVEYLLPLFAFGTGDSNIMHKVPDFSSIADFLSIFFYLGVIATIYSLLRKRILFIKENF